jgi:predicted O-methyltransferase YrrM
MEFLPEGLARYAEDHTTAESETLQKLNRETQAKILQPRMLSGHLQGRTLSLLSKMTRPKYILEIGTYTGYSALCLAEGLEENGELHTIDLNEELERMVKEYVRDAGFSHSIKFHLGNALDIIPELTYPWDLVFIDADKENYSQYYKLLIGKLKSGAIIIADNVLWSGKILHPYDELDEETRALVDFSKMVQEDERVENVLLPIRDGLMVCRKK